MVDPISILQFSDDEEVNPQTHPSISGVNGDSIARNVVKIDTADIQPEVDFWNSSVVCYIVRANPPPMVMEGYIGRIWMINNVDKVALLKKGVFIVRFLTMEMRDKILAGNLNFFDNKPLIVKAWDPDLTIMKEDFNVLPTWIQLKIDFKYWHERCLMKLVQPIGKFVRVYQATAKRDKLQYAHVLLEVNMNQEFPDQLTFINEKGVEVTYDIHYEWKSIYYSECKTLGHSKDKCRKKVQKEPGMQVWKPRQQRIECLPQANVVVEAQQKPVVQENGDEASYTMVRQVSRDKADQAIPTKTTLHNAFEVLGSLEGEGIQIGDVVCGKVGETGCGGGDSHGENG